MFDRKGGSFHGVHYLLILTHCHIKRIKYGLPGQSVRALKRNIEGPLWVTYLCMLTLCRPKWKSSCVQRDVDVVTTTNFAFIYFVYNGSYFIFILFFISLNHFHHIRTNKTSRVRKWLSIPYDKKLNKRSSTERDGESYIISNHSKKLHVSTWKKPNACVARWRRQQPKNRGKKGNNRCLGRKSHLKSTFRTSKEKKQVPFAKSTIWF